MATIRIPEQIWIAARQHLFGGIGEHVVFFLARWTFSCGQPVFMVRDVLPIPDNMLTSRGHFVELSLEGTLKAVNTAVKSGDCLIEAHNHGGRKPRFSLTDRQGLIEFPAYVHSSLSGRPYAATVWGDTTVYSEYFLPDGRIGIVERMTVIGKQLQQVVSRDDDLAASDITFDRQQAWFTPEGQQQLGRFRIAILGCGGTGSHLIQSLAYLGCRDLVLIDRDRIDDTSLNRVVTATPADVGTPKVVLGQRLIKYVAPAAQVLALNSDIQSAEAIDVLKGVDVIFGCVDNDGARLVLNEIAVAYGIPYFDLAVGIDAQSGQIASAGGRVAIVWPGGPCLNCMNQIDPSEVAYFLATLAQRADQVARGYVTGMNVAAPAVVSLNAAISAVAVNEFCVVVSGARPVNTFTELDLLGLGRSKKSQWLNPTHVVSQHFCVQCALAGMGDAAKIERYISC